MSTTIERQIIIGALALLDTPEKWCKGTLTRIGPDGQRQYCIRGAIMEASKTLGLGDGVAGWNTPWAAQTTKTDRLLAEAHNGDPCGFGHVTFQNEPSTTFDEVRALLHKALTI